MDHRLRNNTVLTTLYVYWDVEQKMNAIEFLSRWLDSQRSFFDLSNVTVRILTSPEDWSNTSISVNFSVSDSEELLDLTLWSSGDCELIDFDRSIGPRDVHFEHLTQPDDIGFLLDLIVARIKGQGRQDSRIVEP
jgi:hypothetical protein